MLAACAQEPGGACSQEALARVPITMRRNIPVVPVVVDGTTAQLILDTGAEHTVLLASFVDRIGLKRDFRHAMMIRGVGSAMASAVARPEEMTLGGLEVRRPFVIVSSFSTGDLPGGLPDGLLGADILAGFDVDIDVPRGEMTLYAACPDPRPTWAEPYTALPGRLVRGRFFVPLTVDGATVSVAIDTGAEYSLISARAALAAGVSQAALARDPPTQLAVVGPEQVTARVHRFRELKLGGETYSAPILPVLALPQPGLDGLLGMNYLRRHRLWLSYGSGRVFVQRAAPAVPVLPAAAAR